MYKVDRIKLQNILKLKNGDRPIFNNGNIPVYGANGIMGYTTRHNIENDYIIVIGRIGASGIVHMAKGRIFTSDNAIYSSNYDKKKVYMPYLLSYLRHTNLPRYATKSTHPIITINFLNKFEIPLPPLPVQRKIAEILGAADAAIEKVDQAIAKTERLKKGLMQQLLTKGIGHTQFKNTELGRIPKEWEVVRLGDKIAEMKNGFASGKRDDNGVVQLRMNNVTPDGKINFKSYLKVPIPQNIEEYLLKTGDFVFNNTNSADLVGKSAVFTKAPFPCTYSNHFYRIRFDAGIKPTFILYNFIKLWQKGYFKSVAIRHVGQVAVSPYYINNIKLPMPKIKEQSEIVAMVDSFNNEVETLLIKRRSLLNIKQSLMSDLLTGKRSVKV